MSVITWSCSLCGKRIDGLNIAEMTQVDAGHECRVADIIRLGANLLRQQDGPFVEAVATWLEGEQRQAAHMVGPDDFGICDEPCSTQSALAVARAVIAQEDL